MADADTREKRISSLATAGVRIMQWPEAADVDATDRATLMGYYQVAAIEAIGPVNLKAFVRSGELTDAYVKSGEGADAYVTV